VAIPLNQWSKRQLDAAFKSAQSAIYAWVSFSFDLPEFLIAFQNRVRLQWCTGNSIIEYKTRMCQRSGKPLG
jgi:hypothetical protein